MSQKAIKKRTIEAFKQSIVVPAFSNPASEEHSSTVSGTVTTVKSRSPDKKSLPERIFPLNKFIALPNGLRVKSSAASGDESSQARRGRVPVKAVALPVGSNRGVYTEDYHNNNNDIGKGRHSGGGHALLNGKPKGIELPFSSDLADDNYNQDFVTSTPRTGDSVASSKKQGHQGQQHIVIGTHALRSPSPNGSVNSYSSELSNDGSRKRRYKKRSSSTPPDIGRRSLPESSNPGIGVVVSGHWPAAGYNSAAVVTAAVDPRYTNSRGGYNIAPAQKGTVGYRYMNWVGASIPNSAGSSVYSSVGDSSSDYEADDLDLIDAETLLQYRQQRSHSHDLITTSQDFHRYGGAPVTAGRAQQVVTQGSFSSSPQYATLPKNYKLVRSSNEQMSYSPASQMAVGPGSIRQQQARSLAQYSLPPPEAYTTNGTVPPNGMLIYRPTRSGEMILVNDNHKPVLNGGGGGSGDRNYEILTVGRKQGTLLQSRARFSSMPTLLDSKGDKKLMKLLKKQEKEEKKRIEKEQKKRAKEEKKQLKLEKKFKTKTLPRNFQYSADAKHVISTNSLRRPIESVYRRPQLSLSAVAIDFEDGPSQPTSPAPKMAPPPPPEPSLRTKAIYSSAPDLLRLEQVYGATLRGVPKNMSPYMDYSEHAPRTVVLQRANEGYGFVLRGAKSQLRPDGDLDFRPTAEFPALQYLDSIDPGSVSDRAGLKAGDFILEINGENVVRASHDRVVQLIRGTGDTLAMKVVTVKSVGRPQDWFVNQDRSLTMPNRKKKAAPNPPERDPRTSLSYSKSEGQAISEELKAMEKLEQSYQERKPPQNQTEQKTASIRRSVAAKRVSCVELNNIGMDVEVEVHSSGSPQRSRGQTSNLERSRSTPDLLDEKPVYATPTLPRSGQNQNSNNVYAVPGVSGSVVADVRPKTAPPPPPGSGKESPRRKAPKAPSSTASDDSVVQTKAEVVTISTNKSPYASVQVNAGSDRDKTESPYESSFRPGVTAHSTDKPSSPKSMDNRQSISVNSSRSSMVTVTKATPPMVRTPSSEEADKPSVSFAEDKVYDSAASFLKKHPNAKLMVTQSADFQDKLKKRASLNLDDEPEPDYDIDSGEEKEKNIPPPRLRENRQSVTVISVGKKEEATSVHQNKRYTIHSTIPSENKQLSAMQDHSRVIPPPPSEPAPKPPTQSDTRLPSPRTSPREQKSFALKILSVPETEPEYHQVPHIEVAPGPPAAPPAPPAPPPPPPPPPPAPGPTTAAADKPVGALGLPTSDIMAAAARRQARIEKDGIKAVPTQPKPATSPKDNTQAAILAAVANRRRVLENNADTAVLDSIENRLQKTKKLQAAKFSISGASPKPGKKEADAKFKVSMLPSEKPSFQVQSAAAKKEGPKVPEKKTPASSPTLNNSAPLKETRPGKSTELHIKIETKEEQKSKAGSTIKPVAPKVVVKKVEQTQPKPKTSESKVKRQDSLNIKTVPLEKSLASVKQEEESSNGQTQADFLALAEKKRQEWLQRRSSKSPSDSKSSTPQSSTASTPERSRFKSSGSLEIMPISTKSESKFGQVSVKGATTDQSQSEVTTPKLKPASKMNGSAHTNGEYARQFEGVPPPPPDFQDRKSVNQVVQLEIIPPPANFSTDSSTDLHDRSQHSPAFSPDTASLVSSLSTLSSLSGDQNEPGSRGHSYEDMIAPPPPGFDDYEEMPSVIPPPPQFGNENGNGRMEKGFKGKPVNSWLCVDVLDWLDSLNLGQYKPSFQQNSIDGKKLLGFSRNNYIDLGVSQVGHRMNMERAIKKAAMNQNESSQREIIESERL